MSTRKEHIVGLDIGTTKVCAVVGEVDEDGDVQISGVGLVPSSGIRKGIVVDLDATTRAIEEAVDRAERMAGMKVGALYVSVSGEHIASTNSRGVVAISRGDHEIASGDVERVVDAARMAALPASDREVVHLLPRGFVVDGHDGVRNPVGMYGARLEVEAHIVTGTSTVLANLMKCVQRAGLEVEEIVLEPLASAEAALTPAERELGVVIADIGGGTTSVGVFVGGGLTHTAILPIGGHHITSDIAVGLRTPVAEAEKLKIRFGAATAAEASEGELIEVFNVGDREPRILPRRVLCEIIEPRLQEICNLLRLQIRRSGYAHLVPAGLVLTGGSALLRGITRFTSEKMELPARIGQPEAVGGLTDAVGSPVYATAVGLVLYGAQHRGTRAVRHTNGHGIWGRVRGWMREMVSGA
ncbi:MAG TPA: cell division protein FtsA [bacterium]|nr:cell division protein FtsA [bacterium]